MSKAKKTFSIYEDAYQDCIEVVKSKFLVVSKSKWNETRVVCDNDWESREEQSKRNQKEFEQKSKLLDQLLNVFNETIEQSKEELFIKFGEYLKNQSVGGK